MKNDLRRLCELTLLKLEGLPTSEQIEELDCLLRNDETAQDIYLDIIAVCSGLAQHTQSAEVASALESPPPQPKPDRVQEIQQYAERKLQAYMAEQEELRRQALNQQAMRRSPRWDIDLVEIARKIGTGLVIFKRAIVGCSALAAAVMLMLVVIDYVQSNRIVASLEEERHARWAESLTTRELRPGRMHLEEGFARITSTRGAQIILQGPCEFKLCSPGKMFLYSGAVCAKVPPPAIGFTIETHSLSATDYGTEFGVSADMEQRCEVHVFEGEVELNSRKYPKAARKQRIGIGRVATIDSRGNINIGSLNDRSHFFFRSLPAEDSIAIPGRRLDLADMVGGGNGLGTGIIGGAYDSAEGTINPLTGKPNDPSRPNNAHVGAERYDDEHFLGPPGYVAVSDLPFIDGIFVPDTDQGPCVVDSQGHVFADCPDTCGMFIWNIVNGWRHRRDPQEASNPFAQQTGISLGANSGITFDLDEICRTMGLRKPLRFQARVGLSWNVPPPPQVDIWILVDGQVRFVRKRLAGKEMADISLTIGHGERFLTLVTTDGGRDENYPQNPSDKNDRCFFVEPVIEVIR